jgi:hypothetical protein
VISGLLLYGRPSMIIIIIIIIIIFIIIIIIMACMGDRKGAYRVLVRRPEGKRSLEKPRRKLDDSIKIDLQKV